MQCTKEKMQTEVTSKSTITNHYCYTYHRTYETMGHYSQHFNNSLTQ